MFVFYLKSKWHIIVTSALVGVIILYGFCEIYKLHYNHLYEVAIKTTQEQLISSCKVKSSQQEQCNVSDVFNITGEYLPPTEVQYSVADQEFQKIISSKNFKPKTLQDVYSSKIALNNYPYTINIIIKKPNNAIKILVFLISFIIFSFLGNTLQSLINDKKIKKILINYLSNKGIFIVGWSFKQQNLFNNSTKLIKESLLNGDYAPSEAESILNLLTAPEENQKNREILLNNTKYNLSYLNDKNIDILIGENSSLKEKFDDLSLFLDVISKNIDKGLMVTDDNCIIEYVNKGFCEITGYSVSDSIGQKASFLSSKRHDLTYYKAMWDSIIINNYWSGKILNKRKDGDIYPELLTILPIKTASNSTKYLGIFSDETEHDKIAKSVWEQANFDFLTGVANRNYFINLLQQAISKNKDIYIGLMDLDGFKEVNDIYGHRAGDDVLKEVANRLFNILNPIGGLVARMGGDEFVVMISYDKNLNPGSQKVSNIFSKILDSIRQPINIGITYVSISSSIGITEYPQMVSNQEEILKSADISMYEAKHLGKDRLFFFNDKLQNQVARKTKIKHLLKSAISNNELFLMYQPIVDIKTDTIVRAEALLRWNNPELGFVSPAEFIPISEETNQIHDITKKIIDIIYNDLYKDNITNTHISLNVSPKSFVSTFINEDILQKTASLNISNKIIIEVTEGVLLKDDERMMNIFQDLSAAGVQIAIDDFGTGYSSLSYIQKYNIHYIKIDKSFIDNIKDEYPSQEIKEDNEAIVKAIISMAKSLGLKTIAEGVETSIQRDTLKIMGCDYIQGYFYHKPLKKEDFITKIINT